MTRLGETHSPEADATVSSHCRYAKGVVLYSGAARDGKLVLALPRMDTSGGTHMAGSVRNKKRRHFQNSKDFAKAIEK